MPGAFKVQQLPGIDEIADLSFQKLRHASYVLNFSYVPATKVILRRQSPSAVEIIAQILSSLYLIEQQLKHKI